MMKGKLFSLTHTPQSSSSNSSTALSLNQTNSSSSTSRLPVQSPLASNGDVTSLTGDVTSSQQAPQIAPRPRNTLTHRSRIIENTASPSSSGSTAEAATARTVVALPPHHQQQQSSASPSHVSSTAETTGSYRIGEDLPASYNDKVVGTAEIVFIL